MDLLVSSRTSNEATEVKTFLGEDRPLKLSREQRRQLVEMIANSALGLAANNNLLYAIAELMPEIEEFAPERVALLQKKVAVFNATLITSGGQRGAGVLGQVSGGGHQRRQVSSCRLHAISG
jgi:hypothetical protein